MKPRNRSRTRNILVNGDVTVVSRVGGKVETVNSKGPYNVLRQIGSIQDFTDKAKREDGTYPPSPLQAEAAEWNFFPFNGKVDIGFGRDRVFRNYPGSLTLGQCTHLSVSGLKTDSEYATELLAKTNPFRSEMSLPVFFAELIECTTLFKVVSTSVFTLAGSSYLNYKFGWESLVRDLAEFATVTRKIESRIKEFQSLYRKGGFRRKVQLDKASNKSSEERANINGLYTVPATIVRETRTKVWGSVHWYPTELGIFEMERLTGFNNAVQQVLDLEAPDAETLWQMVPFSFLLDYFIDLSAFFERTSGAMYVEPRDVCIMRKTTTTMGCTPKANAANLSGGGARWQRITKVRAVVPQSDLLAVPVFRLLDDSQWQIILALVLRLSGKAR